MSPAAKNLLIVYHSKTGRTAQMAQAVYRGATHPDLDPVNIRLLRAHEAGPDDLLWCHGILLGTPENFGYMSGALKDFFDRTFYEVEGKLNPLPYSVFIAAGNDGTGAVRAIERIVNGYPFVRVHDPVIHRGEEDCSAAMLQTCADVGQTLAAGLTLGMF